MKYLIVIIVLVLVSSCSTGIEVDDFKPAQGPAGVQMELKLNGDVIDGDKIEGELLAVRPDGVLLSVTGFTGHDSSAKSVVLIPFWMMNTAELEQMGRARVESKGEKNEIVLNRLRLVSRFPQGMSDELLADLMEAYGQSELQIPHRDE